MNADYEQAGFVSVWAGVVPDQAEWDAYLAETYDEDGNASCPFWTDLGVPFVDHDFQEAHWTDAPETPEDFWTPEFSWSASYRKPLLLACRAAGLKTLNAAALLYDFLYPAQRPFPHPALRFVGAFPYSKTDSEADT